MIGSNIQNTATRFEIRSAADEFEIRRCMIERNGRGQTVGAAEEEEKKGRSEYRGIQQQPSGKFTAEIPDPSGEYELLWFGTYGTAEEAAQAYDWAASALPSLKFPDEQDSSQISASAASSSPSWSFFAAAAGYCSSSSSSPEVIEFECLDNKLLDDMLEQYK